MQDEKQRTLQQNKAMHLYFTMLAEALNDAGLDARHVLKPEIEIPWTRTMVKSLLWKHIQDAMFDKDSTTELDQKQVDAVYKVLSRHLSEKFNVYVPFPDKFRSE